MVFCLSSLVQCGAAKIRSQLVGFSKLFIYFTSHIGNKRYQTPVKERSVVFSYIGGPNKNMPSV